MGKGKTAQRAARLAATDVKPKFITVKVRESHLKPNGAWGCRTRWEKVSKGVWDAEWGMR